MRESLFLCTEFVLMLKITRASIHRGGISDSHEQVNRLYDQFGPTPRLCIDNLLKPLEMKEYEGGIRHHIPKTRRTIRQNRWS